MRGGETGGVNCPHELVWPVKGRNRVSKKAIRERTVKYGGHRMMRKKRSTKRGVIDDVEILLRRSIFDNLYNIS